MNTNKSPNLTLVKNTNSWKANSSDDQSSNKNVEEAEHAALALLEAKESSGESLAKIIQYVEKIRKIQTHGTVIQLNQDVEIELFDEFNNGSVCFSFDLANYGIESLASRTHRFWFLCPQPDLQIKAYSEDGEELEVEDVLSSAGRKEVKVHFPRPLEAAERFKYRVYFEVKNDFLGDYYDITARTVTQKISFSLLAPKDFGFNSHTVSRESADGFTNNASPLISLSLENGRQLLSWQLNHPKPGDQFRTKWALRSQ